MEKLTGIERELVLQYLIDGNVPITVTPIEDGEADGKVKPASSSVFPIAIKAEQQKVLQQGIILLTNPSENVRNFIGRNVKVEFYFNRLGLYFETRMKEISAGLALVIPSAISRIEETPVSGRATEFSATLYYSLSRESVEKDTEGSIHIECVPAQGYDIFAKPVWKDVAEEAQQKAKSYLEEFIAHARKQGVAGNGVQLIPVVRFLAEESQGAKVQSIEGRAEPLEVLFANHERIVFGARTNAAETSLKEGCEYALEMLFPMKRPLNDRKIFTTCRVESIYFDDEKKASCSVCRYTSIQEEDLRFLYEKCTNEKLL